MSFTTTWQITRPATGPSTSLHLRTIRKLNFEYRRVGAWLAVSISADRQGFIGKRPGFEAPLSAKIIANGGLGSAQFRVSLHAIFGDIGAVCVIKYNISLSIYLIDFQRLNSCNLDLSSIFRYK
jgi:hypothetical protein